MERLRHWATWILLLAAIWLFVVSATDASQKSIAAGRRASDNEGKWHVAIMHERYLMCSGSLLRNSVVLTSAACVKDLELSGVLVRAGSKAFKKGGQLRRVSETAHHPQYKQNEHGYNIALMKLVRPFNITEDNIGMVRLPNAEEVELPSSVFIYGWGISSLKANRTLSKQLRVAKYKVYSDTKCLRHLSDTDKSNVDNIFCIGDRAKQVDRCNDDIGGPAMGPNNTQYGIISHASACYKANTIILTNIVPYLPWIRGVIASWETSNIF